MEPVVIPDTSVASLTRTPSPLVAPLTVRPHILHNLWAEWQLEGGRRKPVKDFNSGKRGAVKYRYCFFKVLWYKTTEMVRAGSTTHVACGKIYAAYGENLSVTNIIQKMQVDNCSGSWPTQLMVQCL